MDDRKNPYTPEQLAQADTDGNTPLGTLAVDIDDVLLLDGDIKLGSALASVHSNGDSSVVDTWFGNLWTHL